MSYSIFENSEGTLYPEDSQIVQDLYRTNPWMQITVRGRGDGYDVVLLWTEGNEVKGFVCLIFDDGDLFIQWIKVFEEGQGTGSKILNALEGWVKQNLPQYNTIYLEPFKGNDDFYIKNKYVPAVGEYMEGMYMKKVGNKAQFGLYEYVNKTAKPADDASDDEKAKWKRAIEIVEEQKGKKEDSFKDEDWALVTTISDGMKPGWDKKGFNMRKNAQAIKQVDSGMFQGFEDTSIFTFEGADLSPDNIKAMIDGLGLTNANTIYTYTGKMMNEHYGLTGNNAYPDNLNFISISDYYNIGMKMNTGARWFDDIVDNNAYRQEKLGQKQAESWTSYYVQYPDRLEGIDMTGPVLTGAELLAEFPGAEKAVPAKGNHICQYCHSIANGPDEDVLCDECRQDFGHAFYSEL